MFSLSVIRKFPLFAQVKQSHRDTVASLLWGKGVSLLQPLRGAKLAFLERGEGQREPSIAKMHLIGFSQKSVF